MPSARSLERLNFAALLHPEPSSDKSLPPQGLIITFNYNNHGGRHSSNIAGSVFFAPKVEACHHLSGKDTESYLVLGKPQG